MQTGTRRYLGLLLAAGLAGAAGCRSAVADFYDDLTRGGGGAAGSGGVGGTGGIPEECKGDPTQDPGIVRDGCGVFVDAAAPTSGDGTKASPLKSLAEAAKTGKARIFVCARAGTAIYAEEETIVLEGGSSMWGGFGACPPNGDWTWSDAERAAVHGALDVPVVRVAMGDTHIEGFDLQAPDAVTKGASSIALVAEGAAVDLSGVHLVAGAGAPGEDGVTPSETPAAGKDADSSSPTDACVMNTIVAGAGASNTCADGESLGGDGGKGGTVPANDGEPGKDGSPLPAENPLGEGLGGGIVSGQCTDGKAGRDGVLGEPGAPGTAKGTLTVTGIPGGDGGDGKAGGLGYGGGGGGGAKAGSFCAGGTAGAGASGGGGGSGGCGGKGGTGGRAGGSSVGVLSLDGTFTFSGVLVRTAAGGKGGAGGFGVIGAKGGKGAIGGDKGAGASQAGCDGGAGGDGGNGGSGGGGRGGHSIGIAFQGEAPPIDKGITFEIGSPGDGGAGDPTAMNDGGAGMAGDSVDFGAP